MGVFYHSPTFTQKKTASRGSNAKWTEGEKRSDKTEVHKNGVNVGGVKKRKKSRERDEKK